MRVEVFRSAVIDAPVDRVWAALRDFGGHDRWHPEVSHCQVENDLDGDAVGCVRRCHMSDGIELREQLLSHSDLDCSYTYAVLDSSLPLFDNVTTVSLKPVTDSERTFLCWSALFRTSKSRAEEMKTLVGRKIFEAGFTGLRSFLAEGEAPAIQPELEAGKRVPVAAGEPLPGRAVVVETAGGPEVMELSNINVHAPEAGQVRIRQTAVAVNYIDLMYRQGVLRGLNLPGTPGLEGVGEIIDVGGRVDGLFPGDRVAWVSRTRGAYSEICLVDARDCVPLPDGVSDIEASTLLKGLTAGLLLRRVFQAAPGTTILIESIAGGLGHILCQWARNLDLNIIGTVSTEKKARFVRDLGCTHPVVLSEHRNILDEVMRITNGRGVDLLIHYGRTAGLDDAVSCLARFGHMAVTNYEEGKSEALEIGRLKRRSLTVSAHDVLDYLGDRLYLQRSAHYYFAKLQRRAIIPVVESTPLIQAGEAHEKIESRRNMGAIALIPGK